MNTSDAIAIAAAIGKTRPNPNHPFHAQWNIMREAISAVLSERCTGFDAGKFAGVTEGTLPASSKWRAVSRITPELIHPFTPGDNPHVCALCAGSVKDTLHRVTREENSENGKNTGSIDSQEAIC